MTGKSKVSISGRRELDGTHVDVDFGNGQSRSFHLPSSHALYDNFAAHGFGKKVRDQISGCASVEEMVKAYDALTGAFNQGKWNVLRNSDGTQQVGILAKALARLYGKTPEAAAKFVASLSKKQQADARKSKTVAPIIAQILAEEGGDESATEELLAGFGDTSEIQEESIDSGELSTGPAV